MKMAMAEQMNRILIDDTMMETIPHGSAEYPFEFYYENVAKFDFHCIEWHWHEELEFVYLESGTVTFWVGEDSFNLTEGQGILINSQILHRMYSAADAIIPNFSCKPEFISPKDSLIYKKYVLPVLSSSVKYLIFSPSVSWQAEVLKDMLAIITSSMSDEPDELLISSHIQLIWTQICKNVVFDQNSSVQSTALQVRLQLMMQYIQQNYSHNITLEDIATSAQIGKSTALSVFRKGLGTTPVTYLVSYRLKEAARLLILTEKKVHAISLETGFNNIDYFCKYFKRIYGMTPTEYRNSRTDH